MEKDSDGVPDWVMPDSEPESPQETVIFEGSPNTVEATQPEQIFVHASHGGPAGIYAQTNAVLALVLAILGLVFCGLCTAIPGLIRCQSCTNCQLDNHRHLGDFYRVHGIGLRSGNRIFTGLRNTRRLHAAPRAHSGQSSPED